MKKLRVSKKQEQLKSIIYNKLDSDLPQKGRYFITPLFVFFRKHPCKIFYYPGAGCDLSPLAYSLNTQLFIFQEADPFPQEELLSIFTLLEEAGLLQDLKIKKKHDGLQVITFELDYGQGFQKKKILYYYGDTFGYAYDYFPPTAKKADFIFDFSVWLKEEVLPKIKKGAYIFTGGWGWKKNLEAYGLKKIVWGGKLYHEAPAHVQSTYFVLQKVEEKKPKPK